MKFDENKKFVFNSLSEFIDLRKSIKEERTSEVRGEFGYYHLLRLHEISKIFLIESNFNKEELFNLLYENIENENFDDLKNTLEIEKGYGYKNLALVTKLRLANK